ncbi:MAG: TSUP family transporter [Gammaproteobacteria bacterium]|nr:TSUP family transporter [Gammaproteobacteria bacterium]
MDLLPELLSWPIAIALVIVSFFMSALTAVVGVGGGTGMLAVMAAVFPPAVLIPLHGIVQLASNGGRAMVMRRHVHRRILGYFLLGGLVGTVLAANVFIALPTGVLQVFLAVFIVVLVWAPQVKPLAISERGFLGAGVAVNFLGMFVGAVGPLFGACLSAGRFDRHTVVATQGACVCMHYLLKAVAFGVIGFAYLEWLPFIIAMTASGFAGTLVGGRGLDKLPEKLFAKAFRTVLTLFALKLLWSGLMG